MTHLLRAARRSRANRLAPDEGFTLVEVIVSMAILVIAVSALLTALVVTLQATTLGRANQQAGDVANAELEKIRSFSYPQVTLATGDSTLLGSSTYAGELVAVATGGAVQPALTSFVADNRTYQVRRWVTDSVTDASGTVTVRRVTVEVAFEANGVTHTRKASTLVTNTRRGLPLPNFRFDYSGSAPQVSGRWKVTASPSSDADFGLVIRNLGARDTWNLTASPAGWTFHLDTNKNGVRDTGEPTLFDTDGNGVVDTAPIEPSSTPLHLVATRPVGASESGLSDITFTAVSSAQPAAGTKTVPTTLDVTTAAATPTPAPTPTSTTAGPTCTGGTPVLFNSSAPSPVFPNNHSTLTLTLHNKDAGDSTTRNPMALSRDATTQVSTCNYSTEVQSGVAGRYLPTSVTADWDYTPAGGSAKDVEYSGTGVLKVWVKCTGGTTPTITATFGPKSAVTHAATGFTTVTSGCTGTTYTAVPISVSGIDFDSGEDPVQLRVRSNQPVTLLYDAPGAGAVFAVGARK